MFNQRHFETCRLAWAVEGGRVSGWLVIDGRSYDLESFTGVYARLMDDRLLPELDDEPADSPRRRHCRQLHDQLVAWMDVAPARVVNRVRMMGSNGSKPYQSQLIRSQGFRIPETLITNDPQRVREWCARHGRVVYKSISGIRSIVTEVSPTELDRLDAIRGCPVQFQVYVPGFDVRVHTIGDEVFATRIDSSGTDYRYASHDDEGTRLRAVSTSQPSWHDGASGSRPRWVWRSQGSTSGSRRTATSCASRSTRARRTATTRRTPSSRSQQPSPATWPPDAARVEAVGAHTRLFEPESPERVISAHARAPRVTRSSAA